MTLEELKVVLKLLNINIKYSNDCIFIDDRFLTNDIKKILIENNFYISQLFDLRSLKVLKIKKKEE